MQSELYPRSPVLVLDDDESVRECVVRLLAAAGIGNVAATADAAEASRLVTSRAVDLVLLDLHLGGTSGEVLLAEFSRVCPDIPVIVITGDPDTETIVRCMRSGALDYLVKPIDRSRLLVSVWNALGGVELRREIEGFRDRILGGRLEHPEHFASILTEDPRMLALFKYVESVARSRQPVLLTGETGTGKELFARAIHAASGRSGPFVAVNVGGLDDEMFSDTLFGHRKGAYTGADGARPGLLKEAEGGTILLDEIGDLELRSQVKLLRLVQEDEYYPLGSDSPLRSEARIVASTTKDLLDEARSAGFRLDLYYRLHIHPINLPPLRDRRADVPLLAQSFASSSAASLGLPAPSFAPGFLEALAAYDFPGNVRELEALVHNAVASAGGRPLERSLLGQLALAAADCPPAQPAARDACPQSEGAGLRLADGRLPSFREAEAILARAALDEAEGNVSRAAAILGVSRQTLYRKLHELGILSHSVTVPASVAVRDS